MIPSVYRNRSVALLLPLGFASGLPLALSSGTLQAWLTVEGLDIKAIGWFALAGLPYTFKFLWAPLLDRYGIGPFGRRRGWTLLAQLALMLILLAMSFSQPTAQPFTLAILALALAFFSATQDVAIDAWRADSLSPESRGAGAAVSVFGYRLAMLVSGGLALWLADTYFGFAGVYRIMAALMAFGLVAIWFAPEPQGVHAPKTLAAAVFDPLKEFFSRPGAWVLLLLIVLYKLGDAFAGSLSTAFLIRGVGFSAAEVGLVNKTLGLVATIFGALAGGALLAKLGLFRSLMVFGLLQAVTNIGFWILNAVGQDLWVMGAVVMLENLAGGMGTAAFVALLMAMTQAQYSATQFALLSALSAVGRVYVGPSSGYLVEALGWGPFFIVSGILAMPGLLLLLWMQGRIKALGA